MIDDFEIDPKLGVFISDNATNYDSAYRALARRFRLNESENLRRSRCLSHIINLAAQAFIYGREDEAFIIEAEQTKQLTIRDEA